MILKRNEENGIINATYDSSNVLASKYNTNIGQLILTFEAGTQYQYSNVSKTDYLRFETAESQGTVFSSHIKKYPTTKLGQIDPKLILEDIKITKSEEQKALEEGLKNQIEKSIRRATMCFDAIGRNAEHQKQVDDELIKTLTQLQEDIKKFLTIKT